MSAPVVLRCGPDETSEQFIRRVLDAAPPLAADERDEVWSLLPRPVKHRKAA